MVRTMTRWIVALAVSGLMMALVLAGAARAQDAPGNWSGDWHGTLKSATAEPRIGLNHLFQAADTGGPAEYGRIEETISPAALSLITDWVAKTTQR